LSEPIYITGLGALGAWGGGADRLAAALAAGASLASEVDRAAGYHRAGGDGGSRRAALLPAGHLTGWLSPAEARRMSPPSKLAVAASRMALCRSGQGEPGEAGDPRTAVVIATAFGPSTNTEALLKQILFEGPEAASPSLFMESVANAPAAQIAIALQARGASLTVCQREAGPLLALGLGAAEIAAGRAGRVLAGAVDEMTPLLHALLDRFGALAREGADGRELARPFDLHRNGFLAGEGAAVALLESAGSLTARGGQPLARVLAWGSAFDPTAPPSGWGQGHRPLARSLRRTLERAGLRIADVDLVVSGAAGSRDGDRLEAALLRAAWEGAPLPPVAAPKAVTGEYGGGHLAAAVLAASGAPFGPTPGFADPDPELGIVPLDGSPLELPRVVLATALAAGGAAAWIVLGRG
jgi:3-oxoacyl-(acyl-carrier-protein) synthase